MMLNAALCRRIVLCLLAVPLLPTTAGAQTLYGAVPGANSPLYTIATNGAFTAVGNIGFGVTGLAFHPVTGVLYGVTATAAGPGAPQVRNLIRIDTATGAGTLVGPLALGGFSGIADVAFRADGTLFGWAETSDDLITINLTTGKGTVVANAGINTFGSGLAFNASGTLFLAGGGASGQLRTVNTTTGLTTVVANFSGAPFAGRPIPAMKFHPVTNVLYAVTRLTSAPFTSSLITINTATGAITTLGATVPRIDALAWSPTPAPPPSVPPPSPSPSPSPPPAAPSVSTIPDQAVTQNGSVTVSFTKGGAVIANALIVSIASSNTTMLPVAPSTLSASCTEFACTLRITPADGRAGTAIVTVSVSDGTSSASTSFTVTVAAVRPSAPGVLLANAVGSGVVLTWLGSDTGPPMAYAIAWGTVSGASTLPVQLVPGSATRFEFTSLPAGTYFFRLFAVGTGDLSSSSPQHDATVTSSAAPGPPMALHASLRDGGLNGSWRPPLFGATPTLYEIQIGSTLGANDVGSATTLATSFDAAVEPGSYWVRTRASSGGAVGAWTSSVQIPVGAGGCTSAPGSPIVLPVAAQSGLVTFTWWPNGSAADSYQVRITPDGLLSPTTSLDTSGPATSLVWGQASGNFSARVVATNRCGSSAQSNSVVFSIR